MNRLSLAVELATCDGQDFYKIPYDLRDFRRRVFPGRDSGEPFQCDYLALADAHMQQLAA